MNKVYILLIVTVLIIIPIVFYNFKFKKEENKEAFDDPETLNINPISNQIDTYYLQQRGKSLYDTKIKLNILKERLYDHKLDDIVQLKGIVNEKNKNFDVTLKSTNNYNNLYTIQIPIGDQGPEGPKGEKGEKGEKGDRGDRGPGGNCGLLI
tara:strand:+ start:16959 stop:17414 length:456 start_codon:yes stop_codon:yes gene_type:complete